MAIPSVQLSGDALGVVQAIKVLRPDVARSASVGLRGTGSLAQSVSGGLGMVGSKFGGPAVSGTTLTSAAGELQRLSSSIADVARGIDSLGSKPAQPITRDLVGAQIKVEAVMGPVSRAAKELQAGGHNGSIDTLFSQFGGGTAGVTSVQETLRSVGRTLQAYERAFG